MTYRIKWIDPIGNINVTSANAQHYIRTNNGTTRDYDLSFS